jgi:hypothetical protein
MHATQAINPSLPRPVKHYSGGTQMFNASGTELRHWTQFWANFMPLYPYNPTP